MVLKGFSTPYYSKTDGDADAYHEHISSYKDPYWTSIRMGDVNSRVFH